MFRSLLFCCVLIMANGAVLADAPVLNANTLQTPIGPQSLATALQAWAQQSGVQVLYATELAAGLKSQGTPTGLTATESLEHILAGTGLEYRILNARTISVIARASKTSKSPSSSPGDSSLLAQADQGPSSPPATVASEPNSKLEEVVVTGTSIPGVQPSASPVAIYTRADIEKTGATTVEQFFDRLPANFNSLRANAIAGTGAEGNLEGVNGIDLRGLGVGTTLVLIDGRRLAPSSSGRTPDISMIPLSAVERIEILKDGASAIYGSDAVGGVVNFILRSDFQGAETLAQYGSVTSGQHDEVRVAETVGQGWASGYALISATYYDQSALLASERSFSAAAGNFDLVPEEKRASVFGRLEQDIDPTLRLSSEALYSERSTDLNSVLTYGGLEDYARRDRPHDIFVNLSADKNLPWSTHFQLLTTYTRGYEGDDTAIIEPGKPTSLQEVDRDTSNLDITAKFDGHLFSLPGGDARFAVGGGYSRDQYSYVETVGATITQASLGRNTKYGFGELFLPVIGRQQEVPAIDRLEFTLAGRFTDYSDFGSNTSPKFGALWGPMPDFDFRGTYDRIASGEILPMNFVASREMSPLRPQSGGHDGHPAHPCGTNSTGELVAATLPGSFEQSKETNPERIPRRQRLPSEVRDPPAQRKRHSRSSTTWTRASLHLRRCREAGVDRSMGSFRSGLRKATEATAADPFAGT
jgi:iron complex outermembrane receptor protein